jgi:hypothetical protein
MQHIKNPERFYQSTNFKEIGLHATDIDLMADIKGRAFVVVEFKCRGTGLTTGQRILFNRMVEAMGATVPTFALHAEHDTTPDEDITGDNSTVQEVIYRFPSMPREATYLYEEPVPTLNEWITDLGLNMRLGRHIKFKTNPWDGFHTLEHTAKDDEGEAQPLRFYGFWSEVLPILEAEGLGWKSTIRDKK